MFAFKLSNLHMYESYYNAFKTNLKNLDLRHTECESFFRSFKTKTFTENLVSLKIYFDSCDSITKQNILKTKNKKSICEWKKKTLKSTQIGKLCILEAKPFLSKCFDDADNESKLILTVETIKFKVFLRNASGNAHVMGMGEHMICVDYYHIGNDYHEIYSPQIIDLAINSFDDKTKYKNRKDSLI